jgi:hypothetical protein
VAAAKALSSPDDKRDCLEVTDVLLERARMLSCTQCGLEMIIRVGFQSFDFQRTIELPKPLTFASKDEALKWLKHVGFQHEEAINRLRALLTHLVDDPESSRLTDHDVVDRTAKLLYSRRVVIVVRDEGGRGGGPAPKAEAPPKAFPLSERISRASSASSASSSKPVPAEDPPTFDPRVDPVVQAAALVAAANAVEPFCLE